MPSLRPFAITSAVALACMAGAVQASSISVERKWTYASLVVDELSRAEIVAHDSYRQTVWTVGPSASDVQGARTGASDFNPPVVQTAGFSAFDGMESALRAAGVRLFGPTWRGASIDPPSASLLLFGAGLIALFTHRRRDWNEFRG